MIKIAVDWIDHWQTLIAGVLALVAAWLTIRATKRSADREIAASQAQTAVAQKQIETTVQLERERELSEAQAFRAMLAAAMTRVLDEAAWARRTYHGVLATPDGVTVDALTVRQCITKGGFAELRAALIRRGGVLTALFLDLEREIDSFAAQSILGSSPTARELILLGKHAGLAEQLTRIETKAAALHDKAVEQI
jgi:hypothetical protein